MPSFANRVRLWLLTVVSLSGIAIVAGVAGYLLNLVAIGGPMEQRISATQELVADVLPPPANLCETHVLTLRMLESTPDERPAIEVRMDVLAKRYNEHMARWEHDLHGDPEFAAALATANYAAVNYFRTQYDGVNVLVKNGQVDDARHVAVTSLQHILVVHQTAIDRVLELARQRMTETKDRSARLVTRGWIAFLTVVVVALVTVTLAAIRQWRLLASHEHLVASQHTAAAAAAFSERILQTVGALIVVLDRHGRIQRFNLTCEKLTGWKESEVVGRCFYDFLVPEEQRAEVQAVFGQLVAGMFPNQHDNEWLTRDGQRFWIAWSNTCTIDPAGKIDWVIATGVDITQRRHAERMVSEGEERLRQILDSLPIAVAWATTDRRVEAVNRHFTTLFGWTSADLPEVSTWVRRMHPLGIPAPLQSHWDSAFAHRGPEPFLVPASDLVATARDGGSHPVAVAGVAVAGRVITTYVDLADRQRAEAAERQAVVGRMAGRVAHEVNNPLEAIKVFIEPLRRRVRDRPEVDEGLVVIDQQVDRIARLIRSLLDLVRQRTVNRQNAKLDHVITTVVELFTPRYQKSGKSLELQLSGELGSGAIDADEIQQVLINLIENALVAIPRGGRVVVTAACELPWLTIIISDDGPGLGPDPEALFKPFATTKTSGTGLGLPVARRICEAHGGSLTGGNSVDGGARFIIRLRIDGNIQGGHLPAGEVQV